MICKQNTFQVIIFVLDDPGFNTAKLLFVFLSLLVHIADSYTVGAFDVFVDAGDTDTSFVAADFISPTFEDMRIDKGFSETFTIRIHFFESICIDNEYTDISSDLRSCQADSVCFVHRLKKIPDEFFQFGVFGGDIF